MAPDLVVPVSLLFIFAVIACLAGIYHYGEQWFAELEERERDEDRK